MYLKFTKRCSEGHARAILYLITLKIMCFVQLKKIFPNSDRYAETIFFKLLYEPSIILVYMAIPSLYFASGVVNLVMQTGIRECGLLESPRNGFKKAIHILFFPWAWLGVSIRYINQYLRNVGKSIRPWQAIKRRIIHLWLCSSSNYEKKINTIFCHWSMLLRVISCVKKFKKPFLSANYL